MGNVVVLLLTIWLSNGDATARAIIAPDLASCEQAKPVIIESTMKAKVMTIAGEKVGVQYVEGTCHESVRGLRASN